MRVVASPRTTYCPFQPSPRERVHRDLSDGRGFLRLGFAEASWYGHTAKRVFQEDF